MEYYGVRCTVECVELISGAIGDFLVGLKEGAKSKNEMADALNSTDCLPPNTCTEIDLNLPPPPFPLPKFQLLPHLQISLLPAPSQLLPFQSSNCQLATFGSLRNQWKSILVVVSVISKETFSEFLGLVEAFDTRSSLG